MVDPEFVYLATIGMIFEIFVNIVIFFFIGLTIRKYQERKHRLTLYMLIIFLNLGLGVFFSMISKVLVVTIGLEYSHTVGFSQVPDDILYWFLLRIADFRFTFVFLTIGIYFSYVLKVRIFEDDYNKKHRIFIIIYSIFNGVYAIFGYIRGYTTLDTLAFLFIFLFMFIVYIPFANQTLKAYKSTDDPEFKKGFLALSLMAICFIIILFCFFIDRMLVTIPGLEHGFTLFYFFGWISGSIGIGGAYYGYIKPRKKE